MRNLLVFMLFLTQSGMVWAASLDADSCECPKLSCKVDCEVEQDISFYTEKCAGGTRVKSCARPNCVAIENPPAQCRVQEKKGDAQAATLATPPAREIASEKPVKNMQSEIVGKINFAEGKVELATGNQNKVVAQIGGEVREHDRILTGKDGRAQIYFNSGNVLNISYNSEVVVSEASDSIGNQDNKKMVLDLIHGKIRNKVNMHYKGEQSYYRVKAGPAVAGVRGTEFVASYNDEGKLATKPTVKIDTFAGHVELSDAQFVKKIMIDPGETASFIAPKKASNEEMAKTGQLSKVEKLTENEVVDIDKETLFASALTPATKSKYDHVQTEDLPICAAPSGKLNQCSWTCEHNPSGESTCRTDLSEVSCVRRICNANGTWSEPTRLPSSYHEACSANRPVVKDCDY